MSARIARLHPDYWCMRSAYFSRKPQRTALYEEELFRKHVPAVPKRTRLHNQPNQPPTTAPPKGNTESALSFLRWFFDATESHFLSRSRTQTLRNGATKIITTSWAEIARGMHCGSGGDPFAVVTVSSNKKCVYICEGLTQHMSHLNESSLGRNRINQDFLGESLCGTWYAVNGSPSLLMRELKADRVSGCSN